MGVNPFDPQNPGMPPSYLNWLDTVTAGRAVDNNRTSGNVTVQDGTDYEIVITSSNNNVFEGGFYKQ